MMPLPRLAVLLCGLCLCLPAGQGPAWALADRASSGPQRETESCPSCPPCEISDIPSLVHHIANTPSLHVPIGGVLLAVWVAASFVSFALSSLLSSAPPSEQQPASKDLAPPAGWAMCGAVRVELSQADPELDQKQILELEDSIRGEFKESLSMADNVIERLDRLAKEMTGSLTLRQQATLGVTIKMLRNADSHNLTVPMALAKEGTLTSTSAMPNQQVQEWLRDCFTPRSTKHGGTKKSMKVVSKSIMFAVRLKKATSVSRQESTPTDFIPFKAEHETEEQIRVLLADLDSWNFDVWEMHRVSGGREMEVVGWNILHDWGLVKKFGIQDEVLRKWLASVQAAYPRSNNFHNATHGTDVMQTTHYMLKTAQLQRYISELEILGILISAMVHDMGHDGYSNNYHKNAVTQRAIRFNDQSIQEMHHVSSFFDAIQHDDSINILKGLTAKQYLELRAIIIRCVLATDMSKHFQELKDFKQLMSEKGQAVDEWGECTANLMSMVLHACDISGQCKRRESCITWANKCHEEFFGQGDKEKELDLPVSPLCDRTTTDIASSQVGFISFIVLPTWQTMADFFPKVAEEGFPQLKANLEYWESRLPSKKAEEKKAAPERIEEEKAGEAE